MEEKQEAREDSTREGTASRILNVIETISFIGPIAAIVGGIVLAVGDNRLGAPFIVSGVIVGLLSLKQLGRRKDNNE